MTRSRSTVTNDSVLPAEFWATSVARRNIVMANHSRDTRPELALRRLLHAQRLRYKVSARPLVGLRRTAYLVFRSTMVAVFVDGCFWHHCPDHGNSPNTNADYWTPKLERNVQRDRETDLLLEQAGWLSIRVWEHEDPVVAAERLGAGVGSKRESLTAKATGVPTER